MVLHLRVSPPTVLSITSTPIVCVVIDPPWHQLGAFNPCILKDLEADGWPGTEQLLPERSLDHLLTDMENVSCVFAVSGNM